LKALAFDPEALDELREAARWYEERREGLGRDFLREVEAMLAHVRERPMLFQRIAELPDDLDVRRALIRRFPFALVFLDLGESVRVLAVAHTKRRARYWLGRVR
jgi:plasmid stabilization system protein ParE